MIQIHQFSIFYNFKNDARTINQYLTQLKMNMEPNVNMMEMKMDSAISWGTSCVTFLFSSFHAKSLLPFLLGCFTTFLFSVFIQIIQQHSLKKFITGVNSRVVTKSCHDVGQAKNQQASLKGQQSEQGMSFTIKLRLFIYYVITSLLNLLLMLLAMSMNGYVILSIACGVGVGRTIIDSNKTLLKTSKHEQKGDIPQQSPKSDLQPNEL